MLDRVVGASKNFSVLLISNGRISCMLLDALTGTYIAHYLCLKVRSALFSSIHNLPH